MHVVIPHRWRRQPAYPVVTNDEHWFVQKAAVVLPFWEQRNFGRARTSFALSGAFLSGSIGQHLRTGTQGDYLDLGSQTDTQLNSFTILAVVQPDTVSAVTTIAQSGFQAGSDSAGGMQFRVGNTGLPELIKDDTAAIYAAGSVPLTTARMHTIALSYNSSSGVVLCAVDGKYDGTATSAQTFSHRSFVLGRKRGNSTTSETETHRTYLFALHPTVYPREALLELSGNPWQIFRPLKRRIYVNVAAGGGGGAFPATHYAMQRRHR